MPRHARLIAPLALVCLVAVACAPSAPPAPTSAPAKATEASAAKGDDRGKVALERLIAQAKQEPTFDPSHVADLVLAMARLPLDVSVPALTILATEMPYLGRG